MSLLTSWGVFFFALLFVSHMTVEKKSGGFVKNLWYFLSRQVFDSKADRSKPHTHKDGATNYNICLSIQFKPFDCEFLEVCLVKNKAITVLTDRSLR